MNPKTVIDIQRRIELELFRLNESKKRRLLSASEAQEPTRVQEIIERQAWGTSGTEYHIASQQRHHDQGIPQNEPGVSQLVGDLRQSKQTGQVHDEPLVADQYWTDIIGSRKASRSPPLPAANHEQWHYPSGVLPVVKPTGPQLESTVAPYSVDVLIGDFDGSSLDIPIEKALAITNQVCFGMITSLGAEVQIQFPSKLTTAAPVRFDSPTTFTIIGGRSLQGSISMEYVHIIQGNGLVISFHRQHVLFRSLFTVARICSKTLAASSRTGACFCEILAIATVMSDIVIRTAYPQGIRKNAQ